MFVAPLGEKCVYVCSGCVWVCGCMYQRQKGALCSGHQTDSPQYITLHGHFTDTDCTRSTALVTKWKLTRQAKYVQRNNRARSHSHCCRGKAISVTYSECVPVASVIQHALHMRCFMLSSLRYTTFFHILS